MKLLRASLLGILIWVLIFVEISIFKVGLKMSAIPQNIIHFLLLVPITVLAARLYYKSKDNINGFVLGIVFLITGAILDLIITAPLFTGYSALYSDIFLWIGFAELVIVAGVYKMLTETA